jgi:hypothetical protein
MSLNCKIAFILLFLAIAAYGQQERVAILNSMDDSDSIKLSDLAFLTSRLRETAVNVLPKQRYGVMTTESIVAFLGSEERAIKICRESSCLAEIGRKVSADYVAQARLGKFGNDLAIKTELYEVKSGTLIGSFTGYSKDIYGLLALIDEKAPDLFKRMLSTPDNSSVPPPAVVFAAPQEQKEPEVAQEEEYEPYEPLEERRLAKTTTANRKRLDKQPSLLSLDLPDWLQLGLRAGVGFSETCNSVTGMEEEDGLWEKGIVMQFGIMFDIEMSEWFYIQSGLMYIQNAVYPHSYLGLPLLLSLKFSAFRLNAGPHFGIDPATNYFGAGLNAGVGFDIGMFYIGALFDMGFINNINDYKRAALGLNVGVNL